MPAATITTSLDDISTPILCTHGYRCIQLHTHNYACILYVCHARIVYTLRAVHAPCYTHTHLHTASRMRARARARRRCLAAPPGEVCTQILGRGLDFQNVKYAVDLAGRGFAAPTRPAAFEARTGVAGGRERTERATPARSAARHLRRVSWCHQFSGARKHPGC